MKRSVFFLAACVLAAGCARTSEPAPAANVLRLDEPAREKGTLAPTFTGEPAGTALPVTPAPGRVVQQPLLTLSGHYTDGDPRVREHTFPVVLELQPDGRFRGTFEVWMEKRFADGATKLIYRPQTLGGRWTLQDRCIEITVDQDPSIACFPRFIFPEMNGLRIKISRRDS